MSLLLSRVPLLGRFVDERFLEHRRRSSSVAGLAALVLTAVLFDYRLLHDRVWSWDLFAPMAFFVVVKMSMFAFYRYND